VALSRPTGAENRPLDVFVPVSPGDVCDRRSAAIRGAEAGESISASRGEPLGSLAPRDDEVGRALELLQVPSTSMPDRVPRPEVSELAQSASQAIGLADVHEVIALDPPNPRGGLGRGIRCLLW
jgi:hypothetical protein